ncbi:hypothetical protein ACFL1X_04485 [Candidatus Hydrogenedentota bacterium]
MTAKLRKHITLFIPVLMLFLCGCFELDVEMTVFPDKSGEVDVSFVMNMAALQMFGEGMGEITPIAQAESEALAPGMPPDFAKEWKGIDWESAFTKDEGNRLHETGLGTFENIDNLSMGDGEISFRKLDNGNYEFLLAGEQEQGLGGLQGMEGSTLDGMEDMGAMMGPMVSGLSVKYTVILPGDIVETNADEYSGRRATWNFGLKHLTSAKGMDLKVICAPETDEAQKEMSGLAERVVTNRKRSEQLLASGLLSTSSSDFGFDPGGDLGGDSVWDGAQESIGVAGSDVYLRNGQVFKGARVVLWTREKLVFEINTGTLMTLPNEQVGAVVTL